MPHQGAARWPCNQPAYGGLDLGITETDRLDMMSSRCPTVSSGSSNNSSDAVHLDAATETVRGLGWRAGYNAIAPQVAELRGYQRGARSGRGPWGGAGEDSEANETSASGSTLAEHAPWDTTTFSDMLAVAAGCFRGVVNPLQTS